MSSRRTRRGQIRKWWHERVLGHHTFFTVIRDYSPNANRMEFFFRPGHKCLECRKEWPR